MRSVRITWPPKETTPKFKKGSHIKYDGEPSVMEMKRWTNDSILRGDCRISCCDCGLEHLHSYEIVRTPDKKFYMIRRAYRLDK